MKLGTVVHDGNERVVAALDDDTLLDLAAAAGDKAGAFADMLAVINGGAAVLATASDLVGAAPASAILKTADVAFRPPIMPTQFRDCMVFEAHLANCFAVMKLATGVERKIPPVWYQQPVYYKGNRFSFIGHGEDIRWPAYSEFLDIELELAIVIGRKGRDISKADAPSHIFGYTIFNDISARDAQMVEMAGQLGPAKGKDFDTGNVLGPFIVTADEVPHPVALDMEARVNGVRWGGGNSNTMHHDFADIIAHISRSETLYPGEVIGSGTVGTGCGLEIGRRLSPGDRIELEIEKIGVLSNRVVRGSRP